MNKYLSAGTAGYTESTRTIAGATMSTDFASSDVGKSVVFLAGTSVYWGSVSRYVSGTSVVLSAGGNLPSTNVTILQLMLLDQGQLHTFADYLTQIKTLTQDTVEKLSDEQLTRLLQAAISDWGSDVQCEATVRVTGDGTSSYTLATILGAFWKPGETVVRAIEYPQGNVPPTLLESTSFYIYDDGSAQDGSNLKLVLNGYTPGATETFGVRCRYVPELDEVAGQNFPDTPANFNNICMLSASYACFALASVYALSTDSTIMADAVNYSDKTDKYIRLGREFLKRYNQSVFGSEEPVSAVTAATVTMELERRASDRGSLLFH